MTESRIKVCAKDNEVQGRGVIMPGREYKESLRIKRQSGRKARKRHDKITVYAKALRS